MAPRCRYGAARLWLMFGLFAMLVVAVAAGAWWYRALLTIDALEAWVLGLGVWAPIGYAAIYATATVAMVPGGFFDALGGAIFGPVLGSLVNLCGGSVGAALAFLVARYVAGNWVEQRGGARVNGIKRSVEAEGWRFVAMVRLVPIFPYNIFNYLLGLTRIPFWQYIVTSVLCMAPITVAYTWIGHAGRNLVAGEQTDQIRYGLVLLGLVAAAIFLPRLVSRLRKGSGAEQP